MKNYVWLNPVIINSYNISYLEKKLNFLGFKIVYPKEDHLSIIKNEYKNLLKKSNKPILDMRCPLIVDYFLYNKINVKFSKIEPILIHISRELEKRKDLIDGIKWIITPCIALKKMGNDLNLKNTIFLTWDEFYSFLDLSISGKKLNNSPIPFGFFDEIEKNIEKVSRNNLKNFSLNKVRLIEGLYCKNGCHNGDGVKCIKNI